MIDWAVASQTMPGQSETGDRAWVKASSTSARVAVVDGIGHGPGAARAAEAAISTLEENAEDSPADLLLRSHERLRSTRGAVMSVVAFCGVENTMTWAGIGDVEGILFRRRAQPPRNHETLVQAAGVLGTSQAQVKAHIHNISKGDVVILATDGVRPLLLEWEELRGSAQSIADRLLDRYAIGTDDALILVARYGHGNSENRTR